MVGSLRRGPGDGLGPGQGAAPRRGGRRRGRRPGARSRDGHRHGAQRLGRTRSCRGPARCWARRPTWRRSRPGARSTAVDERADVFALGSILCEVLTGAPAFTGRTSAEIQRKAARGDTAEALARLDACGADAELVVLARDCLAAEPRGPAARRRGRAASGSRRTWPACRSGSAPPRSSGRAPRPEPPRSGGGAGSSSAWPRRSWRWCPSVAWPSPTSCKGGRPAPRGPTGC